MSAYSGPLFLAQKPARRSKTLPSCLMVVIFAALSGLVLLALAAVALSRLIAPLSILATPLGLASLPHTPTAATSAAGKSRFNCSRFTVKGEAADGPPTFSDQLAADTSGMFARW